MLQQAFKLSVGLEYEGVLHRQCVLRPLSIAGELQALDERERWFAQQPKEQTWHCTEAADTLIGALSYWSQQLQVDGIPPSALTLDYLVKHLNGEDYRSILNQLDALHAKFAAVSEVAAEAETSVTANQAG